VQCLDPTDDENAPARIAASRRWFETRGVMPAFRVTPLAGRRLTESLDEAEWRAFDHSRVLVTALEGRGIKPDARAEVLPADDPTWLSAQRLLQGYDAATLERLSAIVGAIEVPVRGVLLHSADGRAVASALMSVADGIVFAGNVVTAASERRRGHASAAMRSGLAWAVGEGAKVAALNVLADNEAALALYGSAGFAHVYDYHYRKPAQ
jgi:N-acetylglutamate synthase